MTARLALILASLLLALAVAFGAVTPIGEAAFIAGWLAFAWAVWDA